MLLQESSLPSPRRSIPTATSTTRSSSRTSSVTRARPCPGSWLLGSTATSIMLSDQERRDVMKAVRQSAAPDKVLIAGTGIESAVETLRLTEHAATLGYDLAMVRTPHFYRKQMQPANLLAFYRTVADSSALPVLIYNVPPFTAYDMPAELIIRTRRTPKHRRNEGVQRRCGKGPPGGHCHPTHQAQRHCDGNVCSRHPTHARRRQHRVSKWRRTGHHRGPFRNTPNPRPPHPHPP